MIEISAEIREYLELLIELLSVLIWPTVSAILLLKFRDIISNAVTRSKNIIIKVAGTEIQITAMEASNALSEVFTEIDTVLKSHLEVAEKELFLKILNSPKPPTVIKLFPNFTRGTPEHKMLRALRGVYFIRPIEGGVWEANKHIEVTNFGRIVAKHKKDTLET